jgi:hypothetical protein
VNILDENIPTPQYRLLHRRRIRVRKIGLDIERKGIQDDEIIPFLLQVTRPTFFTRDVRFDNRALFHARYCIVVLAVADADVAVFVRRLLRHPAFNTRAKRMGAVVRASYKGITSWRLRTEAAVSYGWSTA